MKQRSELQKSTATSTEDQVRIERLALDAVEKGLLSRIQAMSFILSLAHFIYGFTSHTFINHFQPEITLWKNLTLRLLLSVLPFILLGVYMMKSRASPRMKISVYIWAYSILFFVAGWIYVWPIALAGQPEIFLYVAGINSAYLCATWTVVAMPQRWLLQSIAAVSIFILFPITFIAISSGQPQIYMSAVNDVMTAAFLGIGLGYMASRIYVQVEILRAHQRVKSSKFIEEPLQQAIFDDNESMIGPAECSAYIFVMDIRDSTNLTRKYNQRWAGFTSLWLAEAMDIISKHSGTFIKSTGDGMLGAFGLFEEASVLADIPGLEQADKKADEIRWINLTVDVFGCINELMNRFNQLATTHFPEEVIRMGCGLDRGKVMRGVRGGRRRQEFDVWGDKVNTAAKLEAFSKTLTQHFEQGASLLVVSPFAADFLDALEGFKKFEINDPVESLKGVRWVLVRSYLATGTRLKIAA
ncbi:MAG: adenylate/guanylate cyclase domain-containing protein [Bdellovibrionales bacterium]